MEPIPTTEPAGAQDSPSPRKKKYLLPLLIAAAVLALYCALCALGGGSTIYPNVTVGGVSLGGLTLEQAQTALTEAGAAQTAPEDRGVVFLARTPQGEEETFQVPLASVTTDAPASADRAFQVGHDQPFPLRGGVYLRCLLTGQEVLPVYANSGGLDAVLDQVEAALVKSPVEPAWEQGEEALHLTRGQPGCQLDRETLRQQVLETFGRNQLVDLTDEAQPQFTVSLEETLPGELNLADILDEVETPVQNAAFDKAAKLFQTDHRGISFDPAAAQATYDALDWGESQDFPLDITQPTTTVADLTPQLYQNVLGSCTTNISGSANRVENIRLAAQYCNGTVLMPGETFSYNGIVGSRSAARGFLPAPAYVGGETVQETGGGVCQGSSTVYLAALRANLKIVERYPHGYITRYVPDGMDATVYYGVKDFRFQNDTPFPLKVQASVSGRSLTVNLLGTKSDNITVEMTNQIVGTTGYNTVYQIDESLPAGSTKVKTTPYTGYTVKVYRNLYAGGALQETRLESTSVYRARDKVVLVSPADAAQYGL